MWDRDAGKTACEETGKRWHQPAEGRVPEDVSPSQPSEGTSPADVLTVDFWPTELERIHFCGLSHSVFSTLLRQTQDTKISDIIFFLPWKPVWGWHMPGVVNGQGYSHQSVQEGDLSLLPTKVLACRTSSMWLWMKAFSPPSECNWTWLLLPSHVGPCSIKSFCGKVERL